MSEEIKGVIVTDGSLVVIKAEVGGMLCYFEPPFEAKSLVSFSEGADVRFLPTKKCVGTWRGIPIFQITTWRVSVSEAAD